MRIVITGANRGIGLELARQYLAHGHDVVAAVRRPDEAPALRALDASERLLVQACDVTDDASVAALGAALDGLAVDVLVNNAGVMGRMQALVDLDLADVMRTIDTNALGALRVTARVLPALLRGATRKIVNVTSGMGSIGDNTSGGAYGYRMSKAALNMACRSMAVDLRAQGVVAVVVNPGWVKTDMGGRSAPTPVEESAAKLIALIDRIGPSESGSFLDYRGHTWPW